MFISPHVPALFKKGTLKLLATEGGGTKRVAEATCQIEPFPASLAKELGNEIAGHLFDNDGAMRPELEGIDLRVSPGLLNVTVHHHAELKPVVTIGPASIKDVSVKRTDDEKSRRSWLTLTFVLVFDLEDKAARNFVLDEFGKMLLWTFRSIQQELLAEASLHESLAKLGDPTGDGRTKASFGVAGGDMHEIDAGKHRAIAKTLRERAKGKPH